MALCWAVFEYFIKFDDTKGEIYLALSTKLRFLITEAVMQEEEEHSFLNARSDEDKAFLLALYRAADITASATKNSEPFINGRKDRDEDLLLFKELHRREKDRLAGLLQPVSDEFEPNIAEMEANAPGNVVQREMPIIQPLSRFADNSDGLKGSTVTVRTPNSKPNRIPQRSVTPGQKQRISTSTENKNSKVAAQILNQKRAQFTTDSNRKTNVIAKSAKPSNQKSSQTNFLSSNLSKDIKTKPENRGADLLQPIQKASVRQKQDPAPRPRRQSCSPGVTRSRKESNEENLTTSKGIIVTGNNVAQIFGSRMADKVMNARKLGAEEREARPKQQSATKSANSSANASPSHGFGRMTTTTKSQMDMAFKHMVIAKDRINSRHLGITSGRNSGQNELD
uniref:Uncharacterized protein n=1 Tax=Populus alba TaxID=43335 RepID=A0A4U5MYQ4_POPAL|nr:hypothetical protein D5086_0000295360 [Populus alba]